jgi:hypothetical protein
LQNNRFYGQNMPLVAGFNVFGGNWDTPEWIHKQCFSEDATKNVSICRQCCASSGCNLDWKSGSLDTDAEWNNEDDHPVA